MTAMSKLSEKLGSGKTVVTAACVPPHGTDPAAVKKLAACFPPSLDGVVVGDHAEQAHGSALACAVLLAAEKVEPVLSLCTRDRNRVALESDVLGAAALGVKTFFCMSGMHQSLGGFPQAAGAYDMDSVQLTQAVAKMAASPASMPATIARRRPCRPGTLFWCSAPPIIKERLPARPCRPCRLD